LRHGLADSPVGLAAWLLDHGDGYGQPAAVILSAVHGRAIGGHSAGDLTRDDVLDDFTLYWLTHPAVSVSPGENYQAPRSWTQRAYPKLIHFNEIPKGGHFAAWEQPELFSEEVRAGFRSLR